MQKQNNGYKKKFSKRDNQMFEYYAKIRHHCSCGHSVAIPEYLDFIYCSWCHKKVFRTEELALKEKEKLDKINFQRKLREQLKKVIK